MPLEANDHAATRALHLLGLSTLAIAQPLFDLLGRNPEFFAARGSQPADILLLAGAIGLGLGHDAHEIAPEDFHLPYLHDLFDLLQGVCAAGWRPGGACGSGAPRGRYRRARDARPVTEGRRKPSLAAGRSRRSSLWRPPSS